LPLVAERPFPLPCDVACGRCRVDGSAFPHV
jgi:hypothetical protein